MQGIEVSCILQWFTKVYHDDLLFDLAMFNYIV